jgi:hypothetical protein
MNVGLAIIEAVQRWQGVLDLLVSNLLTGVLVYLYAQQKQLLEQQAATQQEQRQELTRQRSLQATVTETQQQQTALHQQQTELLRSLNRAVVTIESWHATDDEIQLTLSNIGGSVASELGVSVRLDSPEDISPPHDTPAADTETVLELTRAAGPDAAGAETSHTYLTPDELNERFSTDIEVYPTWDTTADLRVSVASAVEELQTAGESTALLTVQLIYTETLSADRVVIPFWCQDVRLTAGGTLQEMLEQEQSQGFPMTAYDFERSVTPENRPDPS